ncbi:hypothetical protein ACVIDN_004567 [Rhizobium brockwellii]
MFFVTLKFSDSKAKAPVLMEAHNAWLKRGFDDGVFLLAAAVSSQAQVERSSLTTPHAQNLKRGFSRIPL